jgi:hypothetical protein
VDAFKFTVAVGAAAPIIQPGRYVYYRAASVGQDYPEIQVKTNNGDVVKLKPGEGFTFARQYESLIITNSDAQTSITGELVAGDGSFQANRIQGEVSVIDGGRTRTIGGKSIWGYSQNTGAVGEYAQIQIFNPSNSGLNCYIDSLRAWSSDQAGGRIGIGPYDTALTLDHYMRVKKSTSSDSVIELRYTSNPSILAATSNYLGFENINIFKDLITREPYLILPGKGLNVWVYATNKAIHQYIEGFVEPI